MSVAFDHGDDTEVLAPLNLPATVLVESDVRRALWAYGKDGGVHPGSFYEHIVRAFLCADPRRREHLAKGFPVLSFWMDVLDKRVDGESYAAKALRLIGEQVAWQAHRAPCALRHPAYWTPLEVGALGRIWAPPADLPCTCEDA